MVGIKLGSQFNYSHCHLFMTASISSWRKASFIFGTWRHFDNSMENTVVPLLCLLDLTFHHASLRMAPRLARLIIFPWSALNRNTMLYTLCPFELQLLCQLNVCRSRHWEVVLAELIVFSGCVCPRVSVCSHLPWTYHSIAYTSFMSRTNYPSNYNHKWPYEEIFGRAHYYCCIVVCHISPELLVPNKHLLPAW